MEPCQGWLSPPINMGGKALTGFYEVDYRVANI